MFTNKLWYSALLCLVTAYCTLQLTFLIVYTEKEESSHIFSIKGKPFENGQNVIAVNIINLLGISSLLLFLLNMPHVKDKEEKFNVGTLGVSILCIMFSIIFSIGTFATNCYHGTPACYEIHTPLYGLVLLNMHAMFLAILVGILYCILTPFQNLCNKTEPIDYEEYEPINS